MKGVIRIHAEGIRHELAIETGTPQEVYQKCNELKEAIQLVPGTPFVIWLELSSKMNEPDFEGDI